MKKTIIIGLILFAACQRHPEIVPEPVILVDKEFLLTTETLSVEILLHPAENLPTGKYLIRWDWEGDGAFDTPYTQTLTATHRFLSPGVYDVQAEILGLDEQTIQTKKTITISQGFSPPKPAFRITPNTGNPKTIFHFDASDTQDDEEGKELLTFQWDFDGDDQFEFTQTGVSSATFSYREAGEYRVRLVVEDTSGLSAYVTYPLMVTILDTLIVPQVTFSPPFPTDRDTIIFDASESYYTGEPNKQLFYSFKQHNGSWTSPSDTSWYAWGRPLTGVNTLTIKAETADGYFQSLDIRFQVTTGNRPPKASFKRSSRFGNIQTRFFFDAWECSDLEDMPSELKVKWDFDGDGSWDTEYTDDKYATWRYATAGIYHPKIRVMDTRGDFDETELDIHVSGYANPTSYVYDERSAIYYGTVRIGEQWWMGENLRFNPNHDTIPGKFLTWCYDDNPAVCAATGKLYNASQVLGSWNNEWPEDNICPKGWKIPSADDWRELFQYQGIETAGIDLYYGGNTDFNALYGGYAGYHVYGPFVDFEMDSVYKTAVFMSTTRDNKLRVFQLKRDSARAEERLMVTDGYYSIRCIKRDD